MFETGRRQSCSQPDARSTPQGCLITTLPVFNGAGRTITFASGFHLHKSTLPKEPLPRFFTTYYVKEILRVLRWYGSGRVSSRGAHRNSNYRRISCLEA